MILVTGASGITGIAAIRQLARRKAQVRAMTRSEDGAARCTQAGASEAFFGDFHSGDEVSKALQGVRAVYHICPNFHKDEQAIGKQLIDLAKREGVAQFVFHSLVHPMCQKLVHHWEKLFVEEHLIESLIPYTILQPTMYMQNIRVEWPQIMETGVYRRFYNVDVPMSVVDLDDVGEAAAITLTEDDYTGGSFELCSPYPLSHTEMAAILSGETGREIRAEKGDIDMWIAAAESSGRDEYAIDGIAKMYAHYDAYGLPGGNALVLRAILGREPNDYKAFARKWVAAHTQGP